MRNFTFKRQKMIIMKRFKMFMVLYSALALMFSFVACSNSDDETKPDDNGSVKNEKKLVEMTLVEDGSTYYYTFNYDKQGRLITAVCDNKYSYTYQWTDGGVIQTESNSSQKYVDTYQIVDGLLRSGTSFGGKYQAVLSYNSNSRLTYYDFGYDYQEKILWSEDGKLLQDYGDGNLIYDSGKTCKGYNPYLVYRGMLHFGTYGLSLAQPELFGFRINQLPDKMEAPYGAEDDGIIFDYKLDKAGYLEEITVTLKNKGNWVSSPDGEVDVWKFKWQ